MTTAVIPHARKHPTTVDYRSLTLADQGLFDLAQSRADTTIDAGDYNAFMQVAAHAAGLDIAPDGSVVRCACPTCYCGQIFSTALPGLREVEATAYNLPRLQCPTCTDAHPAPHED